MHNNNSSHPIMPSPSATRNRRKRNSNAGSCATSATISLALLVLYSIVAPSSSLSPQKHHFHQHQQRRRHKSAAIASPRDKAATESLSTSTTRLSMALGDRNYLDSINDNHNGDGVTNSGGSDFRDGINSRSGGSSSGGGGGWGNFFNRKGHNNSSNGNSGGGVGGGGPSGRASQDTRRGVGTAIRPSISTSSSVNDNNNNSGGSGYQQKWRPDSSSSSTSFDSTDNANGNGIISKVIEIRQPQDLLDFVITDERLSVVKVYASWCKTCQVFDIRYRKLAGQYGDKYGDASGSQLLSRGNVRFAQMKFDDPNNEEMCKLLNATQLPYILMYKGSKGKVADFQCGPAKFQMLIDAVNEFADPLEEVNRELFVMGEEGGEGKELEWRVAAATTTTTQEEARSSSSKSPLPQQEQPRSYYGNIQYASSSMGSSSVDATTSTLKRKDDEINRLLTEMSNLRQKFDRTILALKEEREKEKGYLKHQIEEQRKQYEKERLALSTQINDLTREMMEREKEYRTGEDSNSYKLRQEMAKKEKEYQETLTGLNLQITQMERDLFKSKNELRYNTDTSESDRKRLVEQINALEEEILSLTSRNEELEKELIEEKRLVVASTEEANRVLLQLNKIKRNEDEERKKLLTRVKELEAQISNREDEIIQGTGKLARDIQQEMEGLKEEHEQERELMAARIIELEQELSYREETWQSDNQSFEEGERLARRIVELERSIDERDRLLKTSNKATDILLDNMEAQKQEYEEELKRTTNLVSELEEAIANREHEMQMLQERLSALERMGGGSSLEQREKGGGGTAGTFSFADAVQMSEGFARATANVNEGSFGGALAGEREARLAAEMEVNKLMGFLKDREEELNRLRSGSQDDGSQKSFFDKMFGAREPKARNSPISDPYDMLNNVLQPDEVSPRRGGMQDDIYGGVGSQYGGPSTYSQLTPSPAVVQPPARLPTPAQAFERRLAENPIVPAGAFGGSKPTASFFQSSPSSGGWDDNAIGAYAAQSGGSRESSQMSPSPSQNREDPAFPPSKAFEQRPTAPVPRQAARQGLSDNIYAGAGTASSSRETSSGRGRVDNIWADSAKAGAKELTPSPSAVYEPTAPLPTPAQAFERRIAENPIVPAGAFGGSRPTAHFFSQSKPSPPLESSSRAFSPQDEAQAKWRSLDESEKKRIASEAYKTFEKQITDSRNTQTAKGGVPASRSNPPNLLSSLTQGNIDQRETKRLNQQDAGKVADMSPDKAKFGAPATAAVDEKKPKNESKPRQTAADIKNSAAAASAKRLSLAELAAQAEADRKAEERRVRTEQRRARETSLNTKNDVDNDSAESASSGNQPPANDKAVLGRKSNSIEREERGEPAPIQIENSDTGSSINGSSERNKKNEPIEKPVDEKTGPIGETSKEPPKEIAAEGETSEKAAKQTTTMEPVSKNEDKSSAPPKNGLKAPKYDVIVKSTSDLDIDMPQLLQGSLTDLLKEGRPKRGSSGNRPSRGRSDY